MSNPPHFTILKELKRLNLLPADYKPIDKVLDRIPDDSWDKWSHKDSELLKEKYPV